MCQTSPWSKIWSRVKTSLQNVWTELSLFILEEKRCVCVCVFLYRRNFYACVNLRVYAALPLPTITAPQPACRKKERGSFKTQIRLLHNQQFCSSPKPPCSTNAHSLSSSPPPLSPSHAGWQSPPNVLLSSLSNSSSLFSSLVPRPTHCLCSCYLLYKLPLWSLPPPPHHHQIVLSLPPSII